MFNNIITNMSFIPVSTPVFSMLMQLRLTTNNDGRFDPAWLPSVWRTMSKGSMAQGGLLTAARFDLATVYIAREAFGRTFMTIAVQNEVICYEFNRMFFVHATSYWGCIHCICVAHFFAEHKPA